MSKGKEKADPPPPAAPAADARQDDDHFEVEQAVAEIDSLHDALRREAEGEGEGEGEGAGEGEGEGAGEGEGEGRLRHDRDVLGRVRVVEAPGARQYSKRLIKSTLRAYLRTNRAVLDALVAGEERVHETVDGLRLPDLLPVVIGNHALLHVAESVNPGLGLAAETGAGVGKSAGSMLDAVDAHIAFRHLKKERHERASELAETELASPTQQAAATSRVTGSFQRGADLHESSVYLGTDDVNPPPASPTTGEYLASQADIARSLERAAKKKRNDALIDVPLALPKTRELFQLHSFIFNHQGQKRDRDGLRLKIDALLTQAVSIKDEEAKRKALALILEAAPWAENRVLRLRKLAAEFPATKASEKILEFRKRLIDDLLDAFLSYKYKP